VGKPVRVCVSVQGQEAVVDVSNAGAPIPPELAATLFNPFKRASLNNPRNRTGMGLGLYIAQQIVREHHGDISYRHDGNEVIFSVRLPLLSGGRLRRPRVQTSAAPWLCLPELNAWARDSPTLLKCRAAW
jgi:signal transduction histidine kinase